MPSSFLGDLPVVTDPIISADLPSDSENTTTTTTIGDVPSENLDEYAMVVLVDRRSQSILLEVPNELGWRLHYGFRCVSTAAEDPAAEDPAAVVLTNLQEIFGAEQELSLRPAGMMLFTFTNHKPMRVKIFEANVGLEKVQQIGKVYKFAEVPYDRMWADDIIWLPELLEKEGSYFEAHFVFQGTPCGSSPLLKHSYQVY